MKGANEEKKQNFCIDLIVYLQVFQINNISRDIIIDSETLGNCVTLCTWIKLKPSTENLKVSTNYEIFGQKN